MVDFIEFRQKWDRFLMIYSKIFIILNICFILFIAFTFVTKSDKTKFYHYELQAGKFPVMFTLKHEAKRLLLGVDEDVDLKEYAEAMYWDDFWTYVFRIIVIDVVYVLAPIGLAFMVLDTKKEEKDEKDIQGS